MAFVLVPPGKFLMGSRGGRITALLYERDSLEQLHGEDTTLHEVTLTEPFYLGTFAVTQAQYEVVTGKNPSLRKGIDWPVDRVSWGDADGYAKALTDRTRLNHAYRLPTEAEWEYACLAGKAIQDSSRNANGLGLYDMIGGVMEWCADRYSDYPKGKATNPVGPSEGLYRVFRGGDHLAVARFRYLPDYRTESLGFRLVRVPSGMK